MLIHLIDLEQLLLQVIYGVIQVQAAVGVVGLADLEVRLPITGGLMLVDL